MKATDMLKLIDKQGTVKHGEMAVAVKVLDVKSSFGNIRLLIEPLAGRGQAWIDQANFSLDVEVAHV